VQQANGEAQPARVTAEVRQRRHVCGDGGRAVPVNAGSWDTAACSETAVGEGEPSAFNRRNSTTRQLADVHAVAKWAGTKTDWHEVSMSALIGKKLLQCLRPFNDFSRRFNGAAMAENDRLCANRRYVRCTVPDANCAPTSCAFAAIAGGLRCHKIFT
jgi:hypothetical protein